MSDKGMMTDDIEDCLNVVLTSLKKCDLPADEIIAWCTAMLDNDRTGFIAEKQLKSLRKYAEANAARSIGLRPLNSSCLVRCCVLVDDNAALAALFSLFLARPIPASRSHGHP